MQKNLFEEPAPKIDLGVKDVSAEEVRALYFDTDALVEPPYKLYRLDDKAGGRNYYRFDADGNPEFFISVTTFISKSLGVNPFLLKWYADLGMAKAEEHKNERADFGTFMHTQIEELTINRQYDLDEMYEKLLVYVRGLGRSDKDADSWYFEMKKDLLSWAQFMIDHKVKPIAIEVMLCSPKYGYAGAIDLVCEMDIEEKGFFGEEYKSGAKKGQPKETKQTRRVKAIVDCKSGKKGFFEAHEIQLHAYKKMFEENYPEIEIERVFNWAGSDWRSTPSYKLKDQTDSKLARKLEQFVAIAKIDEEAGDKAPFVLTEGMINLEEGLERNIKVMTKEELIKSKS